MRAGFPERFVSVPRRDAGLRTVPHKAVERASEPEPAFPSAGA